MFGSIDRSHESHLTYFSFSIILILRYLGTWHIEQALLVKLINCCFLCSWNSSCCPNYNVDAINRACLFFLFLFLDGTVRVFVVGFCVLVNLIKPYES